MNQSNLRRLALSITIASLMLTTTMLFQTATATTMSTMQKSVALTAGADGRAFAVIDGRYAYPSTQRVDYNYPFDLYAIGYANGYSPSPYSYTGIGPKFEYPQSGFDSLFYQPSLLSSSIEVPKFMMMRNTTLNVVSPTINLTAKAVTMGLGGTTEFQADTSNYVLATLPVAAWDQNKLMALTGLLTGSDVDISLLPQRCLLHYLEPSRRLLCFPILSKHGGQLRVLLYFSWRLLH